MLAEYLEYFIVFCLIGFHGSIPFAGAAGRLNTDGAWDSRPFGSLNNAAKQTLPNEIYKAIRTCIHEVDFILGVRLEEI